MFTVLVATASLSPAAEAQASRYVRNGDETIHLRTWGEGPPIVIINGGPGIDSEGFAALASSMSRFGTAIIYDQRGTGRSVIPHITAGTITIDRMVADLGSIRAHFGYEEWVVLGHSFGGMLAAAYAAKHPGRVRGLILSSGGGLDLDLFSRLNVTGRLTPTGRDSLQAWTARIAGGDTTFHARYRRGRHLAPAYLVDTTHVDAVARRLAQVDMRVNALVVADLQRTDFDVREEMAAFQRPVLIIQGAEDIIPVDISEAARDVFPDATLIVLEGSGHYGYLERTDAYFRAIERFFREEL